MSGITLPRVRRIALIALGTAIAALLVATLYANREAANAGGTPANKAWASGDTKEEMDVTLAHGASERSEVSLGKVTARYNNPTDLRLSVTAECALWTNTATFGDDDSESKARVEVWVTIDGKTVPVSSGDTAATPSGTTPSIDPDDQGDAGHVVFCNRANRMKTENIESTTIGTADEDDDSEDDIVIRSYNRSRSANAFNWGAIDVGRNYDSPANGKGIVEIEYHARLATSVTDNKLADDVDSAAAKAVVGKRTLFVEPVKMSNRASF